MVLTCRRAACALFAGLFSCQVAGGEATPHLGVSPGAQALADRAQIVFADGRGLPPGQGNANEGGRIFANRCAQCHGAEGRGGPGGELTGGNPDLTARPADKTIGTYWPYAPTLFDFVRRAMPPAAPWSLRDDEVYTLVAYLLSRDGLWAEDAVLDARGLAAVQMPNRAGFVPIDSAVAMPPAPTSPP